MRVSLSAETLTLFMTGYKEYLQGLQDAGGWTVGSLGDLANMADSFGKLVRSMGRAAPELTAFAVAGDVIRELVDLLKSEHPALVPDMEPILQKLVNRLGDKYAA